MNTEGQAVDPQPGMGNTTAHLHIGQPAATAPDTVAALVLERMTDAFFALDAAWRFTYVNAAAEVALGQPREELLGRNVWEAFPEAVGSPFQQHYELARATGERVVFEAYYPPLATIFSVRAYPDATGLSVFFQDTSPERRNREEQEKLLTRYQALVEGNIIGIVVATNERIIEANDQFLAMVGISRADLEAGRLDWRAITPPEYAARDAQALKELDANGTFAPFEKEYVRPDGTRVPVLAGASLLQRDPMQCVCFILDLTERKRLAKELSRQADLLDQAHEAMLVRTLAGDIVYWNEGAAQLYGWQSAAALGQRSHDLFHTGGVDLAEMEADLRHRGYWEGTLQHTTRDGRQLMVASRQSVVRYGEGDIYVLETNRDITERMHLEREREAMLHSVAHELNTPLTSIKALMQLMRRRAAGGTAIPVEMVERTLSSVERMEHLIHDLLDAARLETGHLTFDPQRVSLRNLCEQAVAEQQAASDRPIDLKLPSTDLFAEVDPERLVQVLTNLLSNALKYSPTGTPVTVRLKRQGDMARVSVTDQGPGIPLDEQARLFERFYRVPEMVVQHGSGVGLGLGLFLVRRLVELHSGQVGVKSTPGDGATFWFTLPLSK